MSVARAIGVQGVQNGGIDGASAAASVPRGFRDASASAVRESRGVSTTVPLFGWLTATHFMAMLHDPLPERTWVYEIDNAAGLVRYDALDSSFEVDLSLDPCTGPWALLPPLAKCDRR